MARRDLPPDPEVLDALCRGAIPPRRPTYAERLAAIRHLAGNRFSDPQIARLVGVSSRTVLRVRTEHGIPGLPLGTNGFTLPQSWPRGTHPLKGVGSP